MKTSLVIWCAVALATPGALAATFTVPATADPWLAGMPNGSTANAGDLAPAQSPVLVTGMSISGGTVLSFSATGSASRGGAEPYSGPDGFQTSYGVDKNWAGAQNGMSSLTAPMQSLIGVFLGPDQPNLYSPPTGLIFSAAASWDYLTLSPELQQPFYIGDGLTSLGIVQQIIAPSGATRLYLGFLDQYAWYNNLGSFTVTVIPEPTLTSFAALAAAAYLLRHRRSRN
jgi:hypothetical protein